MFILQPFLDIVLYIFKLTSAIGAQVSPFLFFFHLYTNECIYTSACSSSCVYTRMHACGGHRTTCRSFILLPPCRIPGIELSLGKSVFTH